MDALGVALPNHQGHCCLADCALAGVPSSPAFVDEARSSNAVHIQWQCKRNQLSGQAIDDGARLRRQVQVLGLTQKQFSTAGSF